MAFTSETAKRAAKRSAEVRREKARGRKIAELSIPDTYRPPPVIQDANAFAAPALPVSRDTLIGQFWPLDRDVVRALNAGGYQLMQRSPIIFQPFYKLAKRISAMDLVAVSKDAPGSDRQVAMQTILDGMPGVPNMIEWFVMFGFTEGVTFQQIVIAPARETGTEFVFPDVTEGQFHKQNAAEPGEGLRWSRKEIAKQRTFNPWAPQSVNEDQSFDPANFIVFAPGGTTNSEGNLHLARVLMPLAYQYEEASKDLEQFIHIFSAPWLILQSKIGGVKPDKVQQLLTSAANQGAALQDGGAGGTLSLNEQEAKLLEPQGTASQIVMDRLAHLEGQAHRIILGQNLTSTTQDTGPTGSSQVHAAEEDEFVTAYTRQIALSISEPLIAWADRMNDDFPMLGDDESELFLQFQPEGRRTDVGLSNVAPEPEVEVMRPDQTGGGSPVNIRSLDTSSFRNVEAAGPVELQVRPGMVLPPAHPH